MARPRPLPLAAALALTVAAALSIAEEHTSLHLTAMAVTASQSPGRNSEATFQAKEGELALPRAVGSRALTGHETDAAKGARAVHLEPRPE
jgi:hypothetical protein